MEEAMPFYHREVTYNDILWGGIEELEMYLKDKLMTPDLG